jgi:hypothetical protein
MLKVFKKRYPQAIIEANSGSDIKIIMDFAANMGYAP